MVSRALVLSPPAVRRMGRQVGFAARTFYPRTTAALRFATSPAGRALGRAVYRGFKRRGGRSTPRRVKNRIKKRRIMKRVGERIGSSNARVENLEDRFTLNSKTLYQQRLLDLVKDSNFNDSTDRRLRDVVNFRGIKFCIHIRNILSANKVLYGHIAVISCKNEPDNSTIPTAEFFRAQGETSRRNVDATPGLLTGLDYYCLPINTDLYNVHKHKRFRMNPADSTDGKNERMFEFWMPIKRQLRYESSSSLPTGKNMYMVMWFTNLEEIEGVPAGNPIADVVQVDYRLTKWFRQTVGF